MVLRRWRSTPFPLDSACRARTAGRGMDVELNEPGVLTCMA